MTHQHYFELQPSEKAIFRGAAQIFSGYVAAGLVNDKNEIQLMNRSAAQALAIARHIEKVVQSDDETGK